jgi:hypothetical protein
LNKSNRIKEGVNLEYFIFFVICILGFFLSVKFQNKQVEEKKKGVQSFKNSFLEALYKYTENKECQNLISEKNDLAIALDDVESKVFIFENDKIKEYRFEDILKTEIIEDGLTINKTSTSSQVGRMLLGGIIAGGVGAAVGGITAASKVSKLVRSIDLKIILNNHKRPVYKINILSNEKG